MVTTVNARTTWAHTVAIMWVPVASFCKGAAHTGLLIAVFITRSKQTIFVLYFRKRVITITITSTNKVCRRRRRRYIDHRRIGVGTVRVASDQGRTDHRWRFILRSVGGRNGLIRRRHGIIVWTRTREWVESVEASKGSIHPVSDGDSPQFPLNLSLLACN